MKTTPSIYNDWEHTSWGDKINVDWDNADQTNNIVEINGHYRTMTDSIAVGDEVRLKFASGKTGRLEVTGIEYKDDPRDLFFAKSQFVGYVE